MSYLHGVEIKNKGTQAVFRVGNTSIIGLVGVAEKGDTELTLITNMADAEAKYGADLPGTSIISSIKALYKNGTSPLLVVNVADSADQLAMMDGTAIGVESGVYYTELHEAQLGQITNAITNLQTKLIAGIEKLKQGEAKYGYKVNFIIAPGYSQVLAVGAKMRSVAAQLKGKAIIDLYATSVTGALAERNANYSYSDNRVILCTPNLIVMNEDAGVHVVLPLSVVIAEAIITTHHEVGFWQSPSNYEITDLLGTSFAVVGSLTDAGFDNQLLNAQGIVTVFKTQGSGTRIWGNWTSKFPTSADLNGMIAASIVEDVIEETIKRESLRFMDKNIGYAALDFIVESVQAFLNVQKSRGALIDGRIWYEQAKNPVTQIASGQFVFSYDFCAHPSLDRLTYESYQNIEYLNNLFE